MRSALVATMSCALLTGCGQLSVAVDVLDPQYVYQEMADERLRKLYRDLEAAQVGDQAAAVDRSFESYKRKVLDMAKSYRGLAKRFPDSATGFSTAAEGLEAAMEAGSVVADVARKGNHLEAMAQGIRVTGAELKWANRNPGPVPASLRDQLQAFEVAARQLGLLQQTELREILHQSNRLVQSSQKAAVASSPEGQKIISQQAAIAAGPRSIIQGSELASTEYAYVVASAPENLWKTNFNRAFASGNFGNVDMVIRLNSTADFSVKGLLFDASKVAQVASKVMTQSVLLGAQIAGVPVASASTNSQTGGDALSKASADLGSVDAAIALRKALNSSQRAALRSAARTIIGSAPALESDLKDKDANDKDRVALHAKIDETFIALKPLLLLQDLQ